MAGELNGTNVLLYSQGANGFDVLMGQLEITNAYTGSPIDISNKTFGDFVTLLNGELSGKQVTLSGSMVYNSDATFQQMRQDRFNGEQKRYRLDYNGEKSIVLTGELDSLGDSLPQGGAVNTTFSIVSSGMPQQEVNLLSSDGFNLVSSDGLTLTAGVPLGS